MTSDYLGWPKMTWNYLGWPRMAMDDLQSPPITSGDLRWLPTTTNGLRWPQMTSNDLGWPQMTSNDLNWPQMTFKGQTIFFLKNENFESAPKSKLQSSAGWIFDILCKKTWILRIFRFHWCGGMCRPLNHPFSEKLLFEVDFRPKFMVFQKFFLA